MAGSMSFFSQTSVLRLRPELPFFVGKYKNMYTHRLYTALGENNTFFL